MFLLLLATLLLGCGRVEDKADVTILNGPEPESLDPAIITGQADMRASGAIFEGLIRYDPVTSEPEPSLAERWDISADGRVYTFHLRSNLVWSTGESLTAHDVVYSWLRVLNPATASQYAGQLFYLKNGEAFHTGQVKDPKEVGVTALDDRTLRVELVEPTPFFLDLCGFNTLAVVPRQTIEKHGDRWLMTRPLPASGAFELVSWRLNDKIRVRRNPRYWDAANTKSETIDFIPCTVANTALNLYQSGQVDIVWDKDLTPSDLMDILLKRPDFHAFDYLATYFFRFNVTRKPMDDVRVRKAMAMAVDKKRIVEKITRGGERPSDHYVPPGVANYESPEGLPYDPEQARRLLAEAGYPGGRGFPRLSYMFNSQKSHEKIAVELQEMWKRELGIDIELRTLEWSVFLRSQNEVNYDLSRSSWIGDYNDANTFLDMFLTDGGNNRTGWSNQRYDQLIREANAEQDVARRKRLLQQAETILIREEAPIVPLFIYVGIEYYDTNKVKGIYRNVRAEHPIRSIYVEGRESKQEPPPSNTRHPTSNKWRAQNRWRLAVPNSPD